MDWSSSPTTPRLPWTEASVAATGTAPGWCPGTRRRGCGGSGRRSSAKHVVALLEELEHADDQVAEVDGVRGLQRRLVARVDLEGGLRRHVVFGHPRPPRARGPRSSSGRCGRGAGAPWRAVESEVRMRRASPPAAGRRRRRWRSCGSAPAPRPRGAGCALRRRGRWPPRAAPRLGPSSFATRSRSSPAALLVKVTARISGARASRSRKRWAMRWVSTRVLPEPAPARMSSGPSPWRTASSCGGFSTFASGSTAHS